MKTADKAPRRHGGAALLAGVLRGAHDYRGAHGYHGAHAGRGAHVRRGGRRHRHRVGHREAGGGEGVRGRGEQKGQTAFYVQRWR